MQSYERSVNRPPRRLEAALEGQAAAGSLASVSTQGRSSHEVSRLIDRLRKLVAEQRRQDGPPAEQEASGREITRLQRRLARVVKRELTRTH